MTLRIHGCIVAAVLVVHTGNVHATKIPLCDGMDKTVNVWTGYATTFHFPTPLAHATLGNHDHYRLTIATNKKVFTLKSIPWASPTNVNVITDMARAAIRVEVVGSRHDASPMYEFIEPPPGACQQASSGEAQSADHLPTSELTEGQWVSRVTKVRPIQPLTWTGNGHRLRLTSKVMQSAPDATMLPLTVVNDGDYPYPVKAIELRDHLGDPVKAVIVHSKGVGPGKHTIPIAGEISFTWRVTPPEQVARGFSIVLLTETGLANATFSWKESDNDIPQKNGPLEGLVLVSAELIGGFTQLDTGIDGRTLWAGFQGAGGRFGFGFNRYGSLIGGIDVFRTTEATADDITSSASGGRIHLGAQVQTGRRLMPYAQLGLGFAFASHRYAGAGAPESQFRVAGVLMWGGGVHMRISKRIVAGLSAAGSTPLGGDDTGFAVEVGLRVGVAFGCNGRTQPYKSC